jgi:membrane protein implicated in regulation of membrane protease activity
VVFAWLILGVVLLAFEIHHFAFYALFGAIGAFAAAVVALIAPSAIPLQVAVAVLAAVIGIVVVRPKMSARLHQRHEGKLGRGVHGTLVGEEVMTLDVVGDSHSPGHVLLAGERWLAFSGADRPIPARTRVLVTAVRGTTLEVWPLEGEIGFIDTDALHSLEPGGDDAEGDQT